MDANHKWHPPRLCLGPVVIIIYINDIDFGLNNLISKFVDNTKIDNTVFSEGDRRSLQEDLRKVSYWSVKWEILFNINKCQILQVRSRNIKNDYEVRGVKIKGIHSIKDLCETVTYNLNFFQQCNESVLKASWMVGLIKRKFSSKNIYVVLPLYNSFSQTSFDVCRAVLVSQPFKRHC